MKGINRKLHNLYSESSLYDILKGLIVLLNTMHNEYAEADASIDEIYTIDEIKKSISDLVGWAKVYHL